MPLADWNEPDGHVVHSPSPPSAEKVPAPHGSGATDPDGQYDPGPHRVHSFDDVSPSSAEYVPGGHRSASGSPPLQ